MVAWNRMVPKADWESAQYVEWRTTPSEAMNWGEAAAAASYRWTSRSSKLHIILEESIDYTPQSWQKNPKYVTRWTRKHYEI